MTLPDRHSLLWKLMGALALLCLLVVSLQTDLSRRINHATSSLSEPAKRKLTDYAVQAETAWRERGTRRCR